MANETSVVNRRKEIVDICLKKFIEKGLYETTSRDLTEALNMRPSALYYHFKNKGEAVLECAEEAAILLEETLLLPVLECLDELGDKSEQPKEVTDEMAAMMQFFAQVCTTNKYHEAMRPVLNRMRKRHLGYIERAAEQLHCPPEKIAPYFYACVASSTSYMIFGEDAYYVQPMELIKRAVMQIKNAEMR